MLYDEIIHYSWFFKLMGNKNANKNDFLFRKLSEKR